MDPGTAIRCEMTQVGRPAALAVRGGLPRLRRARRVARLPGGHAQPPTRPRVPLRGRLRDARPARPVAPADLPGARASGATSTSTSRRPAVWDGDVLRAVDLDLDVIRLPDPLPPVESAPWDVPPAGPGEVFVDDEDEFAEHQVRLRLPRRGRRGRAGQLRRARRGRARRPAAVRRHAPALAGGAHSSDVRLSARRSARVIARNGPTRRGPASRLSSLRASRLSGWATYSPRITPEASAIATEIAVISARMPWETKKPPSARNVRPR